MKRIVFHVVVIMLLVTWFNQLSATEPMPRYIGDDVVERMRALTKERLEANKTSREEFTAKHLKGMENDKAAHEEALAAGRDKQTQFAKIINKNIKDINWFQNKFAIGIDTIKKQLLQVIKLADTKMLAFETAIKSAELDDAVIQELDKALQQALKNKMAIEAEFRVFLDSPLKIAKQINDPLFEKIKILLEQLDAIAKNIEEHGIALTPSAQPQSDSSTDSPSPSDATSPAKGVSRGISPASPTSSEEVVIAPSSPISDLSTQLLPEGSSTEILPPVSYSPTSPSATQWKPKGILESIKEWGRGLLFSSSKKPSTPATSTPKGKELSIVPAQDPISLSPTFPSSELSTTPIIPQLVPVRRWRSYQAPTETPQRLTVLETAKGIDAAEEENKKEDKGRTPEETSELISRTNTENSDNFSMDINPFSNQGSTLPPQSAVPDESTQDATALPQPATSTTPIQDPGPQILLGTTSSSKPPISGVTEEQQLEEDTQELASLVEQKKAQKEASKSTTPIISTVDSEREELEQATRKAEQQERDEIQKQITTSLKKTKEMEAARKLEEKNKTQSTGSASGEVSESLTFRNRTQSGGSASSSLHPNAPDTETNKAPKLIAQAITTPTNEEPNKLDDAAKDKVLRAAQGGGQTTTPAVETPVIAIEDSKAGGAPAPQDSFREMPLTRENSFNNDTFDENIDPLNQSIIQRPKVTKQTQPSVDSFAVEESIIPNPTELKNNAISTPATPTAIPQPPTKGVIALIKNEDQPKQKRSKWNIVGRAFDAISALRKKSTNESQKKPAAPAIPVKGKGLSTLPIKAPTNSTPREFSPRSITGTPNKPVLKIGAKGVLKEEKEEDLSARQSSRSSSLFSIKDSPTEEGLESKISSDQIFEQLRQEVSNDSSRGRSPSVISLNIEDEPEDLVANLPKTPVPQSTTLELANRGWGSDSDLGGLNNDTPTEDTNALSAFRPTQSKKRAYPEEIARIGTAQIKPKDAYPKITTHSNPEEKDSFFADQATARANELKELEKLQTDELAKLVAQERAERKTLQKGLKFTADRAYLEEQHPNPLNTAFKDVKNPKASDLNKTAVSSGPGSRLGKAISSHRNTPKKHQTKSGKGEKITEKELENLLKSQKTAKSDMDKDIEEISSRASSPTNSANESVDELLGDTSIRRDSAVDLDEVLSRTSSPSPANKSDELRNKAAYDAGIRSSVEEILPRTSSSSSIKSEKPIELSDISDIDAL